MNTAQIASTEPSILELAGSDAAVEADLIKRAQEGDGAAIEKLILSYQPWIYNIALRMLYRPEDAQDVTQEILLKVFTGIGSFRGESRFSTWLYRVAVREILNFKRRWAAAKPRYSFSYFAESLDSTPEIPDPRTVPLPLDILVEEAKLGCLTAMLLCLDGRQRLAFILGEVFGLSDTLGGEVMEVSPAAFRQLLTRARRDLYGFMEGKCGLVDSKNPCHCRRKMFGFIKLGHLDPSTRKFTTERRESVRRLACARAHELVKASHRLCAELYRDQPLVDVPSQAEITRKLLAGLSLDLPK
jgi:RNA polymerase sigma factor (sigma-70 family)